MIPIWLQPLGLALAMGLYAVIYIVPVAFFFITDAIEERQPTYIKRWLKIAVGTFVVITCVFLIMTTAELLLSFLND